MTYLLSNWGNIFLVFISKKPNSPRVEDYRPITFSNVIFKLLTKVLANRTIDHLRGLVDQEQYIFMSKHNIDDNILIVIKLTHTTIKSKRKYLLILIKLDFKSSCDKIC